MHIWQKCTVKICIWSDITAEQDYEMHYVNAWLKRWVFNPDLNRESVYKPERYQEGYSRVWEPSQKTLDFAILVTTKSPEICDLKEREGL